MNNYKEEKKDLESFITGTIKKLSPNNKQKAADICLGMVIAQESDKKNLTKDIPKRS